MECRHDQHVGRPRQPAEWIGLAQLHVERNVGSHVAVVFEIDPALIEDFHRSPYMRCAFARRVAEGGEGQQRDLGLVAEPARHARRFDRDIGENFGVGHLGHRGIGDQHGAPARQHERNANHPMAGLRVNAAAHVLERDREIAGDPGDQRVGVAERQHAGGEMVAVLVDQTVAIALQEAFALQPFVEMVGIGVVALRERRIDDSDAAAKLDAERGRALAYAILAADQERAAQSLLHKTRGGADHLFLLAFREDHALRAPPQPLVDALQHTGDRIATAA